MLYRLSGDINIVIIIELSNSLAFFITLFEYLRNLNNEFDVPHWDMAIMDNWELMIGN